MEKPRASPASGRPVLFGVFQTGNHANGGVESVTQLIEHLPGSKVLLTQARMPVNARWEAAGCEVVVVNAPDALPIRRLTLADKLRRAWAHVSVNLTTFRLVRARKVRAVHCNDAASFWHMVAGATLAGTRPIYNVRGVLERGALGGARKLKWRAMFWLSREVIVLSEEMKTYFVEGLGLRGRAAAKVIAIPSIVDHVRLAPVGGTERERLREVLGIPRDCFAVGYIATFDNNKQQARFIAESAPLLKAAGGHVRCFFLGDYDPARSVDARACQATIETEALQEVVHCMGVTREVHNWYRALDAVVLASRREGLARCMIEGMAAGLPVVSFDVCSARETLEGSGGGIIVPQGDFPGLAAALLKLAADPQAASRMGDQGRAYALRVYDAKAVARAYEHAYGQAG